jgi:hypothetical protein
MKHRGRVLTSSALILTSKRRPKKVAPLAKNYSNMKWFEAKLCPTVCNLILLWQELNAFSGAGIASEKNHSKHK